MKKLLVFGFLLGIALAFGCGLSSSPKQVLSKFLSAMEHGDIKEAKKYASADSQSFLDMVGKSNNGSADVYKDQGLIVTDHVTINGSRAKVEVKTNSSDVAINFQLQKESGGWKVVFNFGSLINTAIDAIKSSGRDVHKEVAGALDSLKNDLDSLH